MTTTRTRSHGTRRALWTAAVLATAVGVRQLADVLLRASVPAWSPGATLLVETLAVTSLYGALAWFFVVVPARRRPASPASLRVANLRPVLVAQPVRPALRAVPVTRPRHLALVPKPSER